MLFDIFLNGFSNYIFYRYNRCNLTSFCLIGDGVLIGIHKNISSFLISDFEANVEQVFIHFSIDVSCFEISAIYIPPHYSLSLFESHVLSFELIINRFLNLLFLFCGDENFPEISWDNDDSGLLFYFRSIPHMICIPEMFAGKTFLNKKC